MAAGQDQQTRVRKAPCSTGIAGTSLRTRGLAAGLRRPPSPAPEHCYPLTRRPRSRPLWAPRSWLAVSTERSFSMRLVQTPQAREGKSQALEAKVGGDQLWFSQHQEERLPSGRGNGRLRAACGGRRGRCRNGECENQHLSTHQTARDVSVLHRVPSSVSSPKSASPRSAGPLALTAPPSAPRERA